MTTTVLLDGRIRTMWADQPHTDALAVRDGVVVALGAQARALAEGEQDGQVEVVDLGGRAVLPGLIDVHNHFSVAGVSELFELKFSPAAGVDGILHSYGFTAFQDAAAFLEPYTHTGALPACHCGSTTMPYEELQETMLQVAREGLGIKIHCTGEASVRFVLDATAVLREQGLKVPVQIAHGQFIHPDDVPRLAQLDVTAD